MKRYLIVAYAEEGLYRQEAYVYAKDDKAAYDKAWDMFPEYHEVGAYEIGED